MQQRTFIINYRIKTPPDKDFIFTILTPVLACGTEKQVQHTVYKGTYILLLD